MLISDFNKMESQRKENKSNISHKSHSKKYIPVMRYNLTDVKSQCVNYDPNIHNNSSDLIIYEEVYNGQTKKYCFSVKNDIVNLLKSNLNPITGRLFSLDFITLLRERYGTATIGKLIEPLDFNTEDCTECKDDSCKTDIVLSEDVIRWLQFYISETYMVDLKHHVIPYNIRKELVKVKKCDDYSNKLFRGLSFGLVNIPYYFSYLKMKKDQEFKEEYVKPVSTSINSFVSKSFSSRRTFGIIVQFTNVKKSDILVDLNLIDMKKNKFDKTTKTNIKNEKEVILLPGVYTQKVIKKSDIYYKITNDQLLQLYNIFKDEIKKEDKKYMFRDFEIIDRPEITFNNEKCEIVVLSRDIIKETPMYNERVTLLFDSFDEVLEYLQQNLNSIFDVNNRNFYNINGKRVVVNGKRVTEITKSNVTGNDIIYIIRSICIAQDLDDPDIIGHWDEKEGGVNSINRELYSISHIINIPNIGGELSKLTTVSQCENYINSLSPDIKYTFYKHLEEKLLSIQ